MARVSRTTGFFLVLGVIVLLGTGVGAYFLSMPNSVSDVTDDTSTTYDVFCRGPVDVPSGVSTPVPGVPTGVIAFVYVKEGDFVKAGDPLYRLDDRSAKLKVEEAELAVLTAREQNELAKLSNQGHYREAQLGASEQSIPEKEGRTAKNR